MIVLYFYKEFLQLKTNMHADIIDAKQCILYYSSYLKRCRIKYLSLRKPISSDIGSGKTSRNCE